MRPTDALAAARSLVTRQDPRTEGVWPRAAALLARQALERGMTELYRAKAPGMERCQGRPQLLCLRRFLPIPVAQRAQYTWHVLSRACHFHAYELPPDSRELLAALESVDGLLEAIQEALRR